jgi:hypothetical protein
MASHSSKSRVADPTNFLQFPIRTNSPVNNTDADSFTGTSASRNEETNPFKDSHELIHYSPARPRDESELMRDETNAGDSGSSSENAIDNGFSERESDGHPPTSLVQSLHILQSELRQAKLDIEKLTREKAAIRKQLNEAADANISLEEKKNYNRDEKFFIGEWNTLDYNIRNWASQHFGKNHSKLQPLFGGALKDDLRVLTAYPKNYMDSNDHRPLLIQAFVWNFLVENVFGGPTAHSGTCWAGKAEEDFKNMVAHLIPSKSKSISHDLDFDDLCLTETHKTTDAELRAFHDWRASTAGLLQMRSKETNVNGRIDALIILLEKKLQRYLGGPVESFQKGVRDIIERAVQLDAEFSKQRAHYYVASWTVAFYSKPYDQWVDSHCIFDGASMTNVEGKVDRHRPCRISLVIRPVLFKAGNTFGNSYDVHEVLVKALVTTEHYLKDTTETSKPPSKPPKQMSRKEQKAPEKSGIESSRKSAKQQATYDYSYTRPTIPYNPTPPLSDSKKEKTGMFSALKKSLS